MLLHFHVALVADQHDLHSFATILPQIIQPSRHIYVGVPLSDIVDKQRAGHSLVVGSGNGLECLRAGLNKSVQCPIFVIWFPFCLRWCSWFRTQPQWWYRARFGIFCWWIAERCMTYPRLYHASIPASPTIIYLNMNAYDIINYLWINKYRQCQLQRLLL